MQDITNQDNPLENGAMLKIKAKGLLKFLVKKEVVLNFRTPFFATHLHISETIKKMKVDPAELLDPEKFKEVFASNRKAIFKIIAIAVINDYLKGKLFSRPLALWLARNISREQAYTIVNMYVAFGGTTEFMQLVRQILSVRYTAEGIIYKQEKKEV